MKTLNLFALLLLFLLPVSNLKSQFFSPPVAFTESQSNKANAFLGYAGAFGYLLLWEQSTDSLSTSIYYQRYLTGEDPVLVIGDPGIHYKNPKILNMTGNSDTTFLILFEKVVEAKTEILYIKFSSDGGQSAPIPLAVNGNVNNLLDVSSDYWAYFTIAWNANNSLLTSRIVNIGGHYTFTEPDTVFTGNIIDIKLKNEQLYWLTQNGDSTQMMAAVFDYQGSWTEPDVVDVAEEISSLGGCNHPEDDNLISFSYKSDNSWNINNYHHDYFGINSWFYPLDFASGNAFDFDSFSTFFSVKNDEPEYYFLAYIDDSTEGRELFLWSLESSQPSSFGTECRNPRFYAGENIGSYGRWDYLIWETYIDGYWQLYYSRAPFYWGSIEENNFLEDVSVSPNPATDFIRIQNSKELEISIRIFDATGKLVFQSQEKDPEITILTQNWPRGIYLLNVLNGEKKLTRKIILE